MLQPMQIHIKDDDAHFLRVLWKESDENNTVTVMHPDQYTTSLLNNFIRLRFLTYKCGFEQGTPVYEITSTGIEFAKKVESSLN